MLTRAHTHRLQRGSSSTARTDSEPQWTLIARSGGMWDGQGAVRGIAWWLVTVAA